MSQILPVPTLVPQLQLPRSGQDPVMQSEAGAGPTADCLLFVSDRRAARRKL